MRIRLPVIWMVVFCMLWSVSLWADTTVKPVENLAVLKVANRSVMVFHATILGEVPELRAKRAKEVIGEALEADDGLNVTIEPIMKSYMVFLGSRRAFIVSPEDFNESEFDSVQQAAEVAAEKLRQAVSETQEARNLHLILWSVGAALLATGI